MKKTLIALMALASVAGAQVITLDSGKGGNTVSFFEDFINGTPSWENNNSGTLKYTATDSNPVRTITFYVEVKDLVGGSALSDTAYYNIQSFSFVGEAGNGGENRTITFAVGDQSLVCSLGASSTQVYTTVLTQAQSDSFIVTKNDIVTITLATGATGEVVSAKYYDTNSPGVSFTMKDGAVNDGLDHTINPGNTNWLYNSPVIRLTLIPEPATATLSLLALAGLAARRRRR